MVYFVAEREGFEPPVRLRVLRISSAARSTTLPPLRGETHLATRQRVGPGVSTVAPPEARPLATSGQQLPHWRRSRRRGGAAGGRDYHRRPAEALTPARGRPRSA